MAKQKTKGKPEKVKSKRALLSDPKFRQAVQGAMGDIDSYSKMLMGTDEALTADDAQKKIAQMMYNNMKWMDDPTQAAKYLLAKTMTYQQTMEMVDPEQTLMDIDGQMKLLDSVRKTIKLVNDMKPKELTVHTKGHDDSEIVFINPDFEERD